MSRLSRILVLVIALSCALPAAAGTGADGREYVPGELIVKFKPETAAAARTAARTSLSGQVLRVFSGIGAEQWRLDGVSVADAVALLAADPGVEYAEPNYLLHALEVPDDPRFGELWGMRNTGQTGGVPGADIHAVAAWDVFTGSPDVIVAVIDTGVDYTHPDLAANIWSNPGEIPGNGIDDDGNGFVDDVHGWDFVNGDDDPMDDNGHGTHCSGTIGAVGNNAVGVAGVNWTVSIMALKFLSAGGYGSTADAIAAVEYATAMGVDVMSNSWGGGGYDPALESAISSAYTAGIFFVAAAGNNALDNDIYPHYPSSYTTGNVIAVMASDENDDPVYEPGWWGTNYGAESVDIAAPGLHILSTTPQNSYSDYSGTSMATPHVAGALALLRGRFPNISVDAGRHLLLTIGNDPLPSLNGMCTSGGRLNLLKLVADPDSIPPGDITDLAVTDIGSNRVDLAWTATGDDGTTGTAAAYDVRWSRSPITDETTWTAARRVTGVTDPLAAGEPESLQVEGLAVRTTYYFGVRAIDEYGNRGAISNAVSATTLGPPSVSVAPASLGAELSAGETATQTLTIANVGEGVLDFVVPDAEYVLPAKARFPAVKTWSYAAAAKGEEAVADSVAAPDGAGGPDAFGYTWRDSDDPGGPAFSWIEIAGTGARVSMSDDVNRGPYPIGFTFPFYGTDRTDFRICSNGWISFSDPGASFANGPLPSPDAPRDMLAIFWDDLDPTYGGSVWYQSDGSRLVVEFENVPHYSSGGVYSMQVVLYPNGVIDYNYLDMGSITSSPTIGIQNGDGTDGLTVVSNAAYAHSLLTLRFMAIEPWLATSSGGGSLAAGASVDLDVVYTTAALCGDHFDARLHVISNDPLRGDVAVPVALDLHGIPDIAVATAQLDFGEVYVTDPDTLDLVVANEGCADLGVASITTDNPVFTAAPAGPFSVSPGGTATVRVAFAPAGAGTESGSLHIVSDDPDTPDLVVTLAGLGREYPDIAVSPPSFSGTLPAGATATWTLTVANGGQGDLDFSIPDVVYASAAKARAVPDPNSQPIDLAKSAPDPRVGAPAMLTAGGPDAFGYRWADSDDPDGPAYAWIEIAGTGSPIQFDGDDQNEGPFPLGFSFPFYGQDFAEFRACSNGWLSFTSTATEFVNYALPGPGAPGNLLAPFYDDLTFASGGSAWYVYDGSRMIVEYSAVPRVGGDGTYTFQVQLYPDGRIVYQYRVMTGPVDGATVGIQDADGTDGLTVAFNTPYLHDGMAVRFDPRIPWLAATPSAGTVPPGGTAEITVEAATAGLCGDQYGAELHVVSNDPDTPDVPVPVSIQLTGEAHVRLSDAHLDFGTVALAHTSDLTLGIANTGCTSLVVSGIAVDDSAFSVVAATPITVAPGAATSVLVAFTPGVADTVAGTLTLATNDPTAPSLAVPVTGVGRDVGSISVAPSAVSQSLPPGGSADVALALTNPGSGPLAWTIPSPQMYDKAVKAAKAATATVPRGEEAKGAPAAAGDVAAAAAGGPDAFGYTWTDSDDPDGPAFAWIDIGSSGTVALSGGDDACAGPLPIGFEFPFYGTGFTEFSVSENGYISFGAPTSAYTNRVLPAADAPKAMIAPFWDDLYLGAPRSGDVYYDVVDGNLVVMYDSVMPFSAAGSGAGPFTFEVILSPGGEIRFQYISTGGTPAGCTVGMQDPTGTVGVNVVCNAPYLHDRLAVLIRNPFTWMSCSPTEGVIPAGGSADVALSFDATDLAEGDHTGALLVQTDDPDAPTVRIPVTLTVTPPLAARPAAVPREMRLETAVPNPFNPETTIHYALPADGVVELKVFDVRGALVRTLVADRQDAGFHEAIWNGRNDRGVRVQSGVYFYRLRTAAGILTRRVTLVK